MQIKIGALVACLNLRKTSSDLEMTSALGIVTEATLMDTHLVFNDVAARFIKEKVSPKDGNVWVEIECIYPPDISGKKSRRSRDILLCYGKTSK